MKGMSKKKIGGFMCNSPAATAVCMTPDSRSVIVPGRRSTTERNITTNCSNNNTFNDQNERSFNSVKYSKLIDYRRNNNNNYNQSSQTKLITNNNNSNNGFGDDDNNNNNKTQIISRPASIIKTEQALRNSFSSNYNEKQIVQLDDLHKSSSLHDSPPGNNVFRVVVLRVSLHCQGCAGKLKKHIAKMEGVTSFSIELEHRRVTVMGHVSPVVVLENISKVRRAEFWPTSASTDQYHHHLFERLIQWRNGPTSAHW